MQETVLNNIGTPVLSLVTGFLKTNPAAAKAAQAFAGAPATQAFIKTVSAIAVGIGPAEKAALVCVAFCHMPFENPSRSLSCSADSLAPMDMLLVLCKLVLFCFLGSLCNVWCPCLWSVLSGNGQILLIVFQGTVMPQSSNRNCSSLIVDLIFLVLPTQAGATAVGNVAQGVHATGVTAANTAQAVQAVAGRRHMLQVAAQVLTPPPITCANRRTSHRPGLGVGGLTVPM